MVNELCPAWVPGSVMVTGTTSAFREDIWERSSKIASNYQKEPDSSRDPFEKRQQGEEDQKHMADITAITQVRKTRGQDRGARDKMEKLKHKRA